MMTCSYNRICSVMSDVVGTRQGDRIVLGRAARANATNEQQSQAMRMRAAVMKDTRAVER